MRLFSTASGANPHRPRLSTRDWSARHRGRNRPRLPLGLGNAPPAVNADCEPQTFMLTLSGWRSPKNSPSSPGPSHSKLRRDVEFEVVVPCGQLISHSWYNPMLELLPWFAAFIEKDGCQTGAYHCGSSRNIWTGTPLPQPNLLGCPMLGRID